MIDSKTKFRPVYGTDAKIAAADFHEGWLYVSSDSGKIFIDSDGARKQIGGSGGSGGGGSSSLIWGFADEEQETILKVTEDPLDGDPNYLFNVSAIEGGGLPEVDALIVNADGRFFRVKDSSLLEGGFFAVELIAVSGNGSGGGGPVAPDLSLTWKNIDSLGTTFVYGQDSEVIFYPHSDTDDTVSVLITAIDTTGNNTDLVLFNNRVVNDSAVKINAKDFPASDDLTIRVKIHAQHSTYNNRKGLTIDLEDNKVLKLSLDKPNDFIIGVQSGRAQLSYMPHFTNLGTEQNPVRIKYSVDGEDPIDGGALVTENDENKQYINIPQQSHGMHVVELWLSVVINRVEYTSNKVTYEIPWRNLTDETPIIWTRQDIGTVINYEPAVLQYMVYSNVAEQQGSDIEVSLYHGSDLLNTELVRYDPTNWLTMDLTPYYQVGHNVLILSTGLASKEIIFEVTQEGAKDLSLRHEDQLELNFDALGRSSKEIKSSRGSWVSKCEPNRTILNHPDPYQAVLRGFNWYSNGWRNDNDNNGSYLSVTNRATVTIPMSSITLNSTSDPWSFEIRFRVRNAKKFATLIREIPLYVYYDANGVQCAKGDEKTLEEIEALGGTVKLDSDGNMEMNEENTTRKIPETEKNIAFKYLNNSGQGFAIGTQEAYFNLGGNKVVNVKFKENEIINITFVVDKASSALSIYLNGILSGVSTLENSMPSITMENISFLINSAYCDFDLYKFRVYPIALTLPDVIHNYISDIKNLSLYDENRLTDVNDDTRLSYKALVKYNQDHPSDPTMPYMVIDMSGGEDTDLPCYKGNKKKVRIEFTNPVADYKLSAGEITPFQYYTHCPSFVADNVELNVQGTSSQKYPRRNFKAKFKKAKNWNYTQGELAGQPVAIIDPNDPDKKKTLDRTLASGETLTANWHEDHETIGSNTFTWKIDYMESSGSYNTGFANLLGSGIYGKHPLEDIPLTGVDASAFRTTVYGFPVLVFHRTSEDNYIYIGRYNYNLDKSSNERYGFEVKKPQPFIIDSETGEHPTIKDVAECWELRDNQGTWCSWRYPTEEMRQMHFGARMVDSTEDDPKIEVVQHFEARYHKDADEFEYAQNILLGKPNDDDLSSKIGGSTNAIASTYCRNKLSNLERLFDWLDSTDTKGVLDPPAALEEPVTLEVNARLTDPTDIAAATVTYSEQVVNGVTKTFGTFTHDTKEYRRQKFFAEFDKHLDKEYCAVYFVMTELLLCYDSRGKNVMIATWGPHEEGGDYIWYPIFYDIDTQLGLNNVGAKLWDYNEDCTENGTFSTKDSVLWTNFFDLFKNTIVSTYRSLRKEKVTYNTIENSYMCKAGVTFNSYAMMGKRPIVAIGLDEYYKYVLPTKEPWKNQEEEYQLANYLYACQGDRILSRELFITNRLLYMDSKWLGGTFTINTGGMSGLMFRSTGNKQLTTSDIYLDNAVLGEGQVYGKYPVPYLDAIPEYYVTPYLDFYVTTFVDENVFQTAEAYNEAKHPNGIKTVVSPSVSIGYKSGAPDQQLNYFAGSQYISSLGDLSLKYINQADISGTPRLLDITLGNDHPLYRNNETLDPFDMHTGVNNDGTVKAGDEKSLLEKIILTNVKGINSVLDVRSPDKLREFRALGTNLSAVLFADGAPLKIVHLPNTVTRLIFNQNKDLTKILRETPTVVNMTYADENDTIGTMTYKDESEYEGLFIDGITNYVPTMAGTGSIIEEISFDGDALGYGSYEILRNTVAKKNGTGRTERLRIRMADVSWTPYIQVEYGEERIAATDYYYLTDHSTYEPYVYTTDSAWYIDTLNGRVYTYDDTKDESVITDLSLLDLFYEDKNNTPADLINQFTNNIESMGSQQSYPTLSGEMYVSNADGEAISESDLTNKYAVCWPNLKIRAAKIDTAYIAKYVQRIQNRDTEIDIIRYAKTPGQHATMTSKPVSLANHDFLGWTLNPEYSIVTSDQAALLINDGTILTTAEQIEALEFSSEQDIYIFYAAFALKTFGANYYNFEGDLIYSEQVEYGQFLTEPSILPITSREASLPYNQRYRFVGWVTERNEELCYPATEALVSGLVNVSSLRSQTMDKNFYAVYLQEDVHDSATDNSYFTFTKVSAVENKNVEGYEISPKAGMQLSGKITIPAMYNNYPVVGLGLFYNQRTLTHMFFEDASKVTYIVDNDGDNSRHFAPSSLQYFEVPTNLLYVGSHAFRETTSLQYFNLPHTVRIMQESSLRVAFKKTVLGEDVPIIIPGDIQKLDSYSYGYTLAIADTIQFGDANHPITNLDFTEMKNPIFAWNNIDGTAVKIKKINVYAARDLTEYQSMFENCVAPANKADDFEVSILF